MNQGQKEVLRNIMYAVETGGQVYGGRDYADFTEAYTNTSTEHAITIGAGQWLGIEAKKLLLRIRETDQGLFARLDTAGIAADLNLDWSTYKLSKGSAKARCIVSLIDTQIGHNCQDSLLDEQMEAFVSQAYALGVTSPSAQAMCANFQHQGGYRAMKRIVDKTPKPYTLDNLYEATKSDTGNQVGAYRSRQKFVYEHLKAYMVEDDSYNKIEAAVKWALDIANDNSHGYDQARRDGPDYDCSSFVSWAYYKAGLNTRPDGETPSTHWLRDAFLSAGFHDATSEVNMGNADGMMRGDILLKPGSHVVMYIGNGQIVHASINEFQGITGGRVGDQTGREICTRSYYNKPWVYCLRYKSGGSGGSGGGGEVDPPPIEPPVPKNVAFIQWIAG